MNELTYTMQGDYNLPDLTMPEQPEVTLGRYAQMRRKFLKEHHKIRYYNLLTSCTLTQHLAELEQTAMKLEETLMKQMAAQEGLTESLKAADMMKWVQGMNNLRNRVLALAAVTSGTCALTEQTVLLCSGGNIDGSVLLSCLQG